MGVAIVDLTAVQGLRELASMKGDAVGRRDIAGIVNGLKALFGLPR